MYQACLAFWRLTKSKEHKETLNTLNGVANAVSEQGNYAEAEKLYGECLEEETLRRDAP